MASFEHLKNGKVRARIKINGIRDSLTLPTLKKAKGWAKEREVELGKHKYLVSDKQTLGDLFAKYSEEISPQKDGAHWEQIRLTMFQRRFKKLCVIKLLKLQREDLEDWILERGKDVKSSTVNRELNLISHTLTWARRWRWMSHNPMEDLERPKDPKPRFRPISEKEIQEMLLVLGYQKGTVPIKKQECVAVAFLFAIETAMRAGEICSLTHSNINLVTGVAHLDKTKNGDERDVPLSPKTVALLSLLLKSPTYLETERQQKGGEETRLFQQTSQALSANFRKYRLRSTIQDLTFHDSRHEATTRLADQFHVLELAAITGHRNIKELQTYYNKTAEELALKFKANETENKVVPAELDYSHMAQKLMQELAKAGTLPTQT